MKHFSHLNTAERILVDYKGTEPFSIFLKEFFRADNKYGSRDRKAISQLCYCFFRIGGAERHMTIGDRLVLSQFICSTESNELLAAVKPEWNEHAGSLLEEKVAMLAPAFDLASIFPWTNFLSDGIDAGSFSRSHLVQPDLFLRLRPTKERLVNDKLTGAGLTFISVSDTCIALPNSSKLENVIELDRDAVVQDYNSQRTSEFFKKIFPDPNSYLQVWDCCAASGGKSIMIYDYAAQIILTVSDMRASVLHNLKKRFQAAAIKNYESFVADLSKPFASNKIPLQDLIIADLPCTGSGTWARTPEQLYYFDEKSIQEYAEKQRQILSTIIPFVKPGGFLLYITCSVFKEENEGAVEYIESTSDLQLVEMKNLSGYEKKADSLFGALFLRKN